MAAIFSSSKPTSLSVLTTVPRDALGNHLHHEIGDGFFLFARDFVLNVYTETSSGSRVSFAATRLRSVVLPVPF